MRWLKSCLFTTLIIILINMYPQIVHAGNNTASSNQEDNFSDYDFSEIDKSIDEYSDYDISFREIINSITGDDGISSKGFITALTDSFGHVIKSSKAAIIQIIVLALFSAAINSFGTGFNNGQVSDTTQMIISISLTAILIASFYTACTISEDILDSCINIYKSIVPVFFSAVAFSSGNTTAAVYYEIVLLMITTVNIFFKSILIRMDKIYILFSMSDAVTKEDRFSKASELMEQLIRWACRTAIIVFTGLGGIKGMIVPMTDSYKKSMLYKAFQMIPGVGSSIETVSETVIGAGNIIKNGIGTAAIVVLMIVCFVPVLKLIILSVLFKVTAAVIEPVSDKRIVKAVNSLGTAIGLLILIVLVAVSLFMLMSAMIVLLTNFHA